MMPSKPRPDAPHFVVEDVFTFNAGRLVCGQVRDFLEGLQFEGKLIEWREGRGWFTRNFIVKGKAEAVARVRQVIKRWTEETQDYD